MNMLFYGDLLELLNIMKYVVNVGITPTVQLEDAKKNAESH